MIVQPVVMVVAILLTRQAALLVIGAVIGGVLCLNSPGYKGYMVAVSEIMKTITKYIIGTS